MPFQCDRCGQCCRTHRVPLTVTDLRRLAQSAHVTDPNDCVEWLDSESIDFDDEPESFLELREGRRVPFLRHIPANFSTPIAPPSQCIFLTEQGCQAFSARPSACRSYPYDRPVTGSGKLHLTLAPKVRCPSETDVFVTLHAEPHLDPTAEEYAHLVARRDEELNTHAAWVTRHNRLMQVLTRMGKPRLTGIETLERMLGQPAEAQLPT